MGNLPLIVVVGGPFPQDLDQVLRLVPTGKGALACEISEMFELWDQSWRVRRLGNFPKGEPCTFQGLQDALRAMVGDVAIFLPHLPNVLVEASPEKIRPTSSSPVYIELRLAPKLVESIKTLHPEILLVPFKLAEKDMSKAEIIRWMLKLHAGLAVYSRLGERERYYVIDALANEVPASRGRVAVASVREGSVVPQGYPEA